MTVSNEKRLFLASCAALVLTSMTFAIRARLETVFGPEGVGLTLEQIGFAFMPAFWGFTLAMIVGFLQKQGPTGSRHLTDLAT
jgi:hypothetical protein